MPCGHLDRRRLGHRCAPCQRDHMKCDGARPCGPCRQRKLACKSSETSKKIFKLVQYQAKTSSGLVNQVLGDDAWQYVTVFFNAIERSNGLLTAAYSFAKIGHLVQHNEAVFDAVAAVGATYTQQMHCRPFDGIDKFRQQIARMFNEARALEDPTFLLRASLLGFMELMVDETGERWNVIIQRLQNYYLPLAQYLSSIWKTLDHSLLRLVGTSIIFRVLLFSGGSQTLNLPNAFRKPGPHTDILSSFDDKFEYLIRILETGARLKTRFLRWINTTYSPMSKEVDGLAIISLACELQRDIISTILTSPAEDDFILPMCHWILVGSCRMFSHPAWAPYDWELPVMRVDFLQDQAVIALKGAERMIEKSPMEAVFYGSISPVISLQITSEEERERVLKLLQNIQKKGFKVASAFEADVRLGWIDPNNEWTFY